jgi:polyisoprenyl-teichoic acid--peptidoglycan teichoic acid transferase
VSVIPPRASATPIRYPDQTSAEVMQSRAWWLIALNLLLPGSAQSLAGSRRLARFALVTTFLIWALALAALVLFVVQRSTLLAIATNVVALTVAQVLLAGYAILWLVLGLDTLRLVRLVRLQPLGRAAVAVVAITTLVLVAGTAGYAATVAGSARTLISGVFSGGDYAEPIDGKYTIMLLGGDAGPDRVGLRPDSISVVSIDATTGAATIIGIPRNLEQVPFVAGSPLYQDYPDGYTCGNNCLVSFLYTYGEEHPELYPDAVKHASNPGVEAMRDAVEAVTGLTMQYYVLIDMQGFSDLINALGGVTIDVPEKVVLGKNGDAPIGAIPAGTQQMDGATALWYARSRYNTTDYARMARQRQVQEAILAQFEPATVIAKFQAVAAAGQQVVTTDIPQSMLGRFIELAPKSRSLPITSVELVPANGVVTAHPDYEQIHAMIAAALATSTASPAPTP